MSGFVDPLRTPREVARALAARVKALRLSRNWKRETLACRAGVSLASLKRFETTGEISLRSLLLLASTLGRLGELDGLFLPPPASSLEELEALDGRRLPKRGRQ